MTTREAIAAVYRDWRAKDSSAHPDACYENGLLFADSLIESGLLNDQLETNGAGLIAKERERQITVEGWTPEHDDEHDDEELPHAAAAYATGMFQLWPWEASWWKPSPDPVRNLVKAGALIAAEIDRLGRKVDVPGEPE